MNGPFLACFKEKMLIYEYFKVFFYLVLQKSNTKNIVLFIYFNNITHFR